jgi:hypothetical protein
MTTQQLKDILIQQFKAASGSFTDAQISDFIDALVAYLAALNA